MKKNHLLSYLSYSRHFALGSAVLLTAALLSGCSAALPGSVSQQSKPASTETTSPSAPASDAWESVSESASGSAASVSASGSVALVSASGSAASVSASGSAASVSASGSALDQAVHQTLLGQLSETPFQELHTEGHVILGTQNQNGSVQVYLIAGYAGFGFENNTFTELQGSSAVPAAVSYKQSGSQYTLLSYQEASVEEDQKYLKKLFPSEFQADAMQAASYQSDLTDQQTRQAGNYLKKIGRSAKILTSGGLPKQLFRISAGASNTLLENKSIQDYPSWIGTREALSGSVRTVYESQEQDQNGYVLITYLKKDSSGSVLQKTTYKITGDQVTLLPAS